jgi:hypothetical protein
MEIWNGAAVAGRTPAACGESEMMGGSRPVVGVCVLLATIVGNSQSCRENVQAFAMDVALGLGHREGGLVVDMVG